MSARTSGNTLGQWPLKRLRLMVMLEVIPTVENLRLWQKDNIDDLLGDEEAAYTFLPPIGATEVEYDIAFVKALISDLKRRNIEVVGFCTYCKKIALATRT